MPTEVVVIGAGGFGRETLDVVEAMIQAGAGLRLHGVIDDAPTAVNLERLADRDVRYLGTSEELLASGLRCRFLVAVGDPNARRRISQRWESLGYVPATAVHPRAGLGSRVVVTEGGIVCSGAQLSTNVRLGRHVHVNPNATVGHDTVLGDHVSVNPGAVVSGEVSVGERALIGAGAVILQGLAVGRGAVVGASACVTRDVAAGRTAVGVPARSRPSGCEEAGSR